MAETKKKATAEVKEEAKAEKKPAAKKAPAKKAAAPKKEAAPEAAPKAEEKKPAKKAEVKAEPVKAKVTEAHAVARDVRVTPRKVRLVMDLVRGKSVNEALELLFHVLDGEWELPFALERMRKNTRVYAKKQLTWFQRDAEMHWLHPEDAEGMEKILNKIL